jgi:hypothetical protein
LQTKLEQTQLLLPVENRDGKMDYFVTNLRERERGRGVKDWPSLQHGFVDSK